MAGLAAFVFVVSSLVASLDAAIKCPGSDTIFPHASCEVILKVSAPCGIAKAEILARMTGQSHGAWYDPYNQGFYTDFVDGEKMLTITRHPGTKRNKTEQYIDKLAFNFQDGDGGLDGCSVFGCSESQVASFSDDSSNYCNLHNLYCNKDDGCRPLRHNLVLEESWVGPSPGAGTDKAECTALYKDDPLVIKKPQHI